ncbi:hypothetical protein ACWIGW_10635 [Nocardia brasiliensis]
MVDAVLDEIEDAQALGTPNVRRIGTALLERPLCSLTAEEQYQALADALDSGLRITRSRSTAYSENEARDLIVAIVSALDELRPWPVPALRPLTENRWTEFARATVLAHLDIPWPQVEAALGQTFHRAPDGTGQYLPAKLRSGAEIGFLWSGETHQQGTLIVALDVRGSREAIAEELATSTGIEPEDITMFRGNG